MIDDAFIAELLSAGAEEQRQALQSHVFECAGGTMPQFQDVGILVERGDGADVGRIEVAAICGIHELVYLAFGQVDAEGLVDVRRALRVGHGREIQDLVQRELGDALGNVESAAVGQALHYGLGKRNGFFRAPARIYIKVSHRSLHSMFGSFAQVYYPTLKCSAHCQVLHEITQEK